MSEKQPPLFVKWYTVLLIATGLLFLALFTVHTRNFYHPFIDVLSAGYTILTIANCVFGIPTVIWMFVDIARDFRYERISISIPIPVQIDMLELTEWVQSRGSTSGYIYILKDIDVTGYCKIGMTRHPYIRMKDFGVKLPFRTELLQVIETKNPEALERFLHHKYKKQRIRGEWFNLNAKDIEYIKSL